VVFSAPAIPPVFPYFAMTLRFAACSVPTSSNKIVNIFVNLLNKITPLIKIVAINIGNS
jgi:hypothetical protein